MLRSPVPVRAFAATGLLAAGFAAATPARAVPGAGSAEDASIIVTARQYAEPLHQVPFSITAFEGAQIALSGAERLSDLARGVPNLIVVPVGTLGAEQPAIRGIFSPAGSATTGLYLDDVPIQMRSLGFGGSADIRTFDLVRAEVLRGPQGTLFGASSMGGTIRFITRQPDLDETSGYLSATLEQVRGGGLGGGVEGAVGVPLLPGKIGLRTGFYYRRDGGYVDRVDGQSGAIVQRDVNDVDALALRAAVKAAVGETVELTPALHYQRTRRGDFPFFDSTRGPHLKSSIHEQPGREEFILPSLTLRADLGGATLTSVTAHLDRTDRQTTDYSLAFGELVLGGAVPGLVPAGGTRSLTKVTQRSFSQELRFASPDGAAPLRWVFGFFYRRASFGLTQNVIEPGIADLTRLYLDASVADVFGVPLLPGGVSYRGSETVREDQVAAFGEASWRISERLEALAGLRVTRSRLDLEVVSEGPYAGGAFKAADAPSQRETPVTPRLGLSYRLGESALVHAGISKGFRVGGANPPVPAGPCGADLLAFGRSEAPASFGSDSLWSYEAGFKGRFAPGLSLSASLFRIDWKGIQQPVMLPGCGFSFTDNLGRARSRGFEFEGEARLAPGLRTSLGLGFVDARFGETILGGVGEDGRVVIAGRGDRIPYVPRWTTRVAADYELALPGALRGFLHGEVQYVSAYRRAPSEEAAGYDARVDRGHDYANALLRAGVGRGPWQVSLFVDNLFDDRSILFSSADLVPATGSPLRQQTLTPRTAGVSAALQF